MLKLIGDPKTHIPKFQQIINVIVSEINSGILKINSELPSITQLCESFSLSRVTVSRAFMNLKNRGYISIGTNNRYFVSKNTDGKLRVLLVFNRLSNFKNQTYYGILNSLGDRAIVDLQLHHYDVNILNQLLDKYLGCYDYYVIMPHFFHDTNPEFYLRAIKRINQDKLLILDKQIKDLDYKHKSVYQDFKNDTYQALETVADLLTKYDSICIINSRDIHYPIESSEGVMKFAVDYSIDLQINSDINQLYLSPGTIYIVAEDEDLVILLRLVKQTNFVVGYDIGIIAWNETVLKDLLDITVFTTDFTELGRRAGDLLLSKNASHNKNPYQVIFRKSL